MKRTTTFQAIMKCFGYVVLFFGLQLASEFLVGGVLGFVAAFAGKELTVQDATLMATRVLYETLILSGLLFFGVVFLKHFHNFSEETSFKKASPSSVGAGVFLGLGSYGITGLLLTFLNALVPAVQQSQEGYMQQQALIDSAQPAFWAEIVYVCIAAPILEELLCRGLILNTLKKHFEPKKAILISAIFFAWIHGNLYQAVFTLPLGLLLGWMAYRFSSLWPSILIHVLFNFSNFPARICMELGFSSQHPVTNFVYLAWLLLCFFAIPIGYLLLKHAFSKTPPPPPFVEGNPYEQNSFGTDGAPFTPPFAAPREMQNQNHQGGSMAAPEYLIVGLGNPGDKYAQNRHNVGFMALDYIALREHVSIQNLRFKALTGECTLGGKKVLLMKPQTFMNLSGEAVREAAAFYKIPAERVLVIFDDINFEPGVFRIRNSGSAGGHNGIKSIISCLGSDAFPRVKLGVGTPPPQWELMNWVLGNPSPADQKKIIASLEDVYDSAKRFTDGKLDRAAALYNGKIHE